MKQEDKKMKQELIINMTLDNTKESRIVEGREIPFIRCRLNRQPMKNTSS
ncbi:hypothetical protein [Anoxybacillus flavithermus]|nr:hypothetical protein [Anoxybacillus flavithermus]